MVVIYGTNNSPVSWLIRAATMGKYSHCGVLDDDGQVIHSTFSKGVHRRTLEWFKSTYSTNFYSYVVCPDEAGAMRFLKAQLGKPYDWTALLKLVFQRDWQENDSWFCSELVEAAVVAGNNQRFRDAVQRITPHQSWSVL